MRTLTMYQHLSLDGVIQSPGGEDEDRDGGFRFGGWCRPYADPLVRDFVVKLHQQPFDLLLGRRTYDIWSGYWPGAAPGPIADAINAATKYVLTHRPESLSWGPASGLGTDLGAGVARLKATDGPGLILWGSSMLTPELLSRGLIDRVTLFVYPVLLGSGKRLYADMPERCGLTLVGSQAAASGIVINHYQLNPETPDGQGAPPARS